MSITEKSIFVNESTQCDHINKSGTSTSAKCSSIFFNAKIVLFHFFLSPFSSAVGNERNKDFLRPYPILSHR